MVGYRGMLPPCRFLLARWNSQTCIARQRAGAAESQARAANALRSRRRSRVAGFRLSGAAVFWVLDAMKSRSSRRR